MSTAYPDLWAALTADFPDVRKRNDGILYIEAEQIEERLDAVLGPENWDHAIESDPGTGGVICRLEITLPDGRKVRRSAAGAWIYKREKERVGRGPSARTTELESDPSNMAAYRFQCSETNALVRAAKRLGIGRWVGKEQKRAKPTQAPVPPTTERRNDGRELALWAKKQFEATKLNVPKWLNTWGEKKGYPTRIGDWSPDQADQGFEAASAKLAEQTNSVGANGNGNGRHG
jgi:hypothetical protein